MWPASVLRAATAIALVESFDAPAPKVFGLSPVGASLRNQSASSIVGGNKDWATSGSTVPILATSNFRPHEARSLSQIAAERRAAARSLLRSWLEEGDEIEQQSTLAFLVQALDADRTSDRKLFP